MYILYLFSKLCMGQGPNQHVRFFYVHSHFRASQYVHYDFSTYFELFLKLNTLVGNLLFELCTGILKKLVFTVAVQNTRPFCAYYLFILVQKLHISFLHIRRAHKYSDNLCVDP